MLTEEDEEIKNRIGIGPKPLTIPGTKAWADKYGRDKTLEDVYGRRKTKD